MMSDEALLALGLVLSVIGIVSGVVGVICSLFAYAVR
jgi:hypothetical protein